jgi:hypothetical protein
MTEKQYLGIYLTNTGATVALVEPGGHVPRLHSCFRVASPAPQGERPVTLADEVARLCTDRQFFYGNSALALDRCFYSQHKMRSQFRESSRIAETVKFDAEEALTVDTSNLAVTFDVLSVDDSGSDLNVYAADVKAVSTILTQLQAVGIDPLTFEPDSVALARFLGAILPPQERNASIYVFFSGSSCSLVTYPSQQEMPYIRTFIAASSTATETLSREITLTIASLKLSAALSAIRVCDPQGRVNIDALHKRLKLTVEAFDLTSAAGFSPVLIEQGIEPLSLAIACGAAMADFTKGHKADFRSDFSPHLGRARVVEKTVKAICLALTFIILAIGLYLQLKVFVVNRDRQALAAKLAVDYKAVMSTERVPSMAEAVSKLGTELRAVKELKSGMLTTQGQETVTGLLTYVLEAINSLPSSVDLQLDQIKVTPKAITLSGNTNKPDSTLALFQKIQASPYLSYTSVNEAYKNGRDEFGVTILPKRNPTGATHAPQSR